MHQGGGRTLLLPFLASLPSGFVGHAFLDTRLDVPFALPKGLEVHGIRPTLRDRFLAEWRLRRLAKPADKALCFGNLPPLFKLNSKVIVLLQNRFLVSRASLRGFPMRTRARLSVERTWLSLFASHADVFLAQTPSMKLMLKSHLGRNCPIHVMPFAGDEEGPVPRTIRAEPDVGITAQEFLYVATGEPHKNHRALILAWCLLAEERLFPKLCLTISAALYPELCSWIDDMARSHCLLVENLGQLPLEDVKRLYTKGRALIHPSTLESLPMPVIEARRAGLPIVAAELDHIRDVVDPEQSFQPDSPLSIARAVKRMMGVPESDLPLLSPGDFLSRLEEL